MRFTINRAKFIEELSGINKILVDACKNEKTHYIVDDGNGSIENTAAFKNGMLEAANLGLNCPVCGEIVGGIMNPSDEETIFYCDKCKKVIPSELYESKPYVITPKGVAEFVKKSLGCGYCQSCGDGNYRLGKLYGKHVYFCISPDEGLFNSHNENITLVVCDTTAVPKGWANDNCKVVPFTELFYAKNGEIRVADILDELKPKEVVPRFSKHERVADRRDEWLEVLAHILDKPFNPKDIRKDKTTSKNRLSPAAAARWFSKVHPKLDVGPKMCSRDMKAFCVFDKKTDRYDKREPVIKTLLELVANPRLTDAERKRASVFTMDQLLKARGLAKDNEGVQQKLPDVKWSVGADGRSERVLATSNESIYDNVDRNLQQNVDED